MQPSCFCHYERSEVIQKQVLLAMGLPRRVFYTSRNDKIRMASHGQVQGCHSERSVNCHREESFKTTWRSVGNEIASVTTLHRNDKKRVVRRLPRRVFYTSRNDKNCGQEPRASAKRLSWREALCLVAGSHLGFAEIND